MAPGDIFTQVARLLVHRTTVFLAFILAPVDYAARAMGKLSVVFIAWGLLLFLLLSILWLPFWGLLVGSSWLWLNQAWTRPILLLPGAALCMVLTVFLMLVPDPQKHPRYVTLTQEWPLTWTLWHPPFVYFKEHNIWDPEINPYEAERLFGTRSGQEPTAGHYEKYDPKQPR